MVPWKISYDYDTLTNKLLIHYQIKIDINATTAFLRIEILSAYPGEEFNGQNPFEECAIQEIRFFGKDTG